MESIGERIFYIRKTLLNLNQKDFSKLIGVSQGTLSDIEKGNRSLSIEALTRLYEYLTENTLCSFAWLLLGTGEPFNTTVPLISEDEQELLNGYRQLDSRGRHIIHAAIYRELDRINPPQKDTIL